MELKKIDYRKKAEEIFLWAKCQVKYSAAWESHSFNTAKIAREIARVCGMEEDKAAALGLLHDIGRCVEEDIGLEHPVLGYELLKKWNFMEAAKVSMTHTYYGYKEISRKDIWTVMGENEAKGKEERRRDGKRRIEGGGADERREGGTRERSSEKGARFRSRKTLDFTRKYMEKVELDDYDLLIQLADNMAGTEGIMTISDRFSDIMLRHKMEKPWEYLDYLYRLKEYFDRRAGRNIYELFRAEIIKTALREPNLEENVL